MRLRAFKLPHPLSRPGAVIISALLAVFFAFWSVATISIAPPGIYARQTQIGAAATHVMFDAPSSLLTDRSAVDTEFATFVERASMYGSVIASPPVRELIGRRIGVDPDRIAAISRLTSGVQRAMREPDSEQRANQLRMAPEPYRLEIQADPEMPVLHVYAQAPSVSAAERLADAAVLSLQEYLAGRGARNGAGAGQQVVVAQLGRARGQIVNGQTVPVLVGLTLLIVFGLSLCLLLGAGHLRRAWAAADPSAGAPPAPGEPRPGARAASFQRPALPRRRGPAQESKPPQRRSARLPREAVRSLVNAGADWPRTTRVMPWMIAGFMVILWLVPFNTIQLTADLPFDLKFDRLVLPFLFAVWILSLVTGGPASPRLRLTLIHVGIAGFLAVTCIGILLQAYTLDRALEFELPAKKLTLILSYALLFAIIASTIRRSEVPAFFKYTLGLAILMALGTIWEYRFQVNLFHMVSDGVLPGIFQIVAVDSTIVDDIGRRMTRGPAEHPLETTAMISMALPIALVGIIHNTERRSRLLYCLGACILLAAAISTYRKSALLAPLAIVLTIAYFRRRELIKLAPLGVVSLFVIHALSPGAMGSILVQLKPSRLGVSTVSDRSADYDAIRPDMWSNLLFGRGYGSYDHVTYRILDSEILSRVVDTGLLGLATLVLMIVSILLAARGQIRARHPVWSPPALAVSSAAVAFFLLAFLFDVTSFPHTPYILLSLAGLLAAMLGGAEAAARAPEGGFDARVLDRMRAGDHPPDPTPAPRQLTGALTE